MADNKEPKKTETPIANPGAKKKKLLIFAGAGLVLLLLLGGGTAFLFLKKDSAVEKKPGEDSAAEVQVPELTPSATIGPMIEIKEFIVNIISESGRHYVKASLTIELVGKAEAGKGNQGGGHGEKGGSDPGTEEVNQRMPQIRDSILLLIGNKTYEELQDLQGKKQLKAELISKINSILYKGRVKDIYFTDFVVQ